MRYTSSKAENKGGKISNYTFTLNFSTLSDQKVTHFLGILLNPKFVTFWSDSILK